MDASKLFRLRNKPSSVNVRVHISQAERFRETVGDKQNSCGSDVTRGKRGKEE